MVLVQKLPACNSTPRDLGLVGTKGHVAQGLHREYIPLFFAKNW